ncbi:MAG: type II secretion system protein N [Pseudomonadota bacterium]
MPSSVADIAVMNRGSMRSGLVPLAGRAALVLLVAMASWLAVRLVIALVAPTSLWEPVLVAGPVQASQAAARAYDFSYNPFEAGDAPEIAAPEPVPGDDAPETTLDLQLTGQRSGENGTAFIRTPDGQDRNYYADEEIMPGVVLRGVFPGFVLIDVNGQTQRLTMEDMKRGQVAGGATAPSRPAQLQTLRIPDATTLLSQVRLTPATDEAGQRIGLEVSARTGGVDLGSYGLRDGDVVTRFAGQSVTSGTPDIAALRRTVSSGQPVRLDIVRDGQPMTITIGSTP